MTVDIKKSVRGERQTVSIQAFTFAGDPLFYDVDEGYLLAGFEGICTVYGLTGETGVFRTGFAEEGETRFWECLGVQA